MIERVLKIDVDEEGYNKSRCPYNSEIMLGGLACKCFCKFFKSFDYDKREVVCTLDMKDFVGNMVKKIKRPECNWMDDEDKK